MNNINDYSEYKIKRETMTRIADKLRVVVGKTTPLTPAENAYYIDRIIFTPQSYATSNINNPIVLMSTGIGLLPMVYKTISNSILGNNKITSNATGILPEVYKSISDSTLGTIKIVSNANGILI